MRPSSYTGRRRAGRVRECADTLELPRPASDLPEPFDPWHPHPLFDPLLPVARKEVWR